MKHNYHLRGIFAIITLHLILVMGGMAVSAETAQLTDSQTPTNGVEEPTGTSTANPTHENLRIAYAVGKEIGHPETLQAILLQETGGGTSAPIGNRNSPVGKRSYGLMQVQTVAARSVFERFPEVFEKYFPRRTYKSVLDEEIIALLLTNGEANIRIAAYTLKINLRLSGGDWSRAVAAYNAGIGGVNNIPVPSEYGYVVSVKKRIDTEVREFNRNGRLR